MIPPRASNTVPRLLPSRAVRPRRPTARPPPPRKRHPARARTGVHAPLTKAVAQRPPRLATTGAPSRMELDSGGGAAAFSPMQERDGTHTLGGRRPAARPRLLRVYGETLGSTEIASIETSRPRGNRTSAGAERAGGGSG